MLDATEMMPSHPSFLVKTFRKVRPVYGLQDDIVGERERNKVIV